MFEPLADQLRPSSLDDFVGQKHVLGKGKPLRKMIEKDRIGSLILFGPPGTGKTTLAHIVANCTKSEYVFLNTTESGIKVLREIINKAKLRLQKGQRRTIVFIDEIHRWARNQQDVLLPVVEKGIIILIGATTQNPYFSVNGPLISRSQLFEFRRLEKEDLEKVMETVIKHYGKVSFEEGTKELILSRCGGDARKLISTIELIAETTEDEIKITMDEVQEILPRKHIIYGDDDYFDGLSAIQGSIQASDPHSAVYWLAWLLNRGEDINVIARRLLVTAGEDVSISDPRVLPYVNAACQAAERVGMPEAQLLLAPAVAYMAMTPRSKAAANAIWEAMKIDKLASKEIPDWLKDCHYKGAEKLGRGSYHDGSNQDAYEPIIRDLFKPVAGLEVKLMEHNDTYWKSRIRFRDEIEE